MSFVAHRSCLILIIFVVKTGKIHSWPLKDKVEANLISSLLGIFNCNTIVIIVTGNFVEKSRLQEDFEQKTLTPGTLLEDVDFEEMTKSSDWASFVRSLFPPGAKRSTLNQVTK